MYLSEPIHVDSKDAELYAYCAMNAERAKRLYNAALFRIRQIFCGYEKAPSVRSANEQEVFHEIDVMHAVYPEVSVRRVIGYTALWKLMKANAVPDLFSGLPAHAVQYVMKQAVQDFKNWLAALRDYGMSPGKYTGMPKMPGYKKTDMCTFTVSNEESYLADGTLKLPKFGRYIPVSGLPEGTLKEIKITPFCGRFIMHVTIEVPDTAMLPQEGGNYAGIDFGTDNFAAIVSTDSSSVLYKGGAILANNQRFAKERARLVSCLTSGKMGASASSKRLTDLSYHRANFNRDCAHKISRDIITHCREHGVTTLVLGVNKGWKQRVTLGKANNQAFVQMPIGMLQQFISYKAAMAGITVIFQEESYTSKASFIDGDYIPVYGKDDSSAAFSGKRICRGLYRTKDGRLVNADLNAAANILKKAVPQAWGSHVDIRSLQDPKVVRMFMSA